MRFSLPPLGLPPLGLIAASLLAGLVLVACQTAAPGGAWVASDAISVTALDAPVTAGPSTDQPAATTTDPTTPRPKPRPGTDPAADTPAEPATSEPDAAAEPEAPKPPEQLLCEKTGGQWAMAGTTGAYICVKLTRDGGKMCRKKSDCEGLCLARSGTCAPFTPLFGCNEVLEKDGRRMTLCID